MSIQRILHIITLLLFIVFVATFFTVFARLSRVGFDNERFARMRHSETPDIIPAETEFELIGQNTETGALKFRARTVIDIKSERYANLIDGSPVILRVENMKDNFQRNIDLIRSFSNPANDTKVSIEFGEFELDLRDKRDFYPFDGYDVSFNFAIFSQGSWYEPKALTLKSLTNLILLNPRYITYESGVQGYRLYIARIRLQQFLTFTLLLIEVLFMIYLLTTTNLQDLLRQGLGYLVGLYIVREILTADAPQFPTLVDYSTMFLICVAFFLMLFRFLGGAEERMLITLPPILKQMFESGPEKDDEENQTGSK